MYFESDDIYLGNEWPKQTDVEDLFEMAKVLQGHEIYKEYRDRLYKSGKPLGDISLRQLCFLVLEDMHAKAGMNVTYKHF